MLWLCCWMIAFGTDYPVEPVTPFRGIYCAVTRQNEAGTKSYYPEQKLTIDQALAAYTSGSAYAEFEERDKGWICGIGRKSIPAAQRRTDDVVSRSD